MEALLTIMFGVVITYALFELGCFILLNDEPDAGGREADPTRDGEAVVVADFVSIGNSHISGGKVQLNGATWAAEYHCNGVEPQAGDRVRIMARDRLMLIVEPIERITPDRPG